MKTTSNVRVMRQTLLPLFAVGFLLTASACSISSPVGLTVRGQNQTDTTPVQLTGDFHTAYYADTDPNNITFVLIDGDENRPSQAVVIRLFWQPRAGRTPLQKTATNCTLSYLVFAPDPDNDRRNPGQVGVYTGAGFLMPASKPGPAQLVADMWDASLQLDTRSEHFADLLGQATLTGSFEARRDPAKVDALLHQLNRSLTDRLGFPRLVKQNSNPNTPTTPTTPTLRNEVTKRLVLPPAINRVASQKTSPTFHCSLFTSLPRLTRISPPPGIPTCPSRSRTRGPASS